MAQDFLDFPIKVSFNYGYLRETQQAKTVARSLILLAQELFYHNCRAVQLISLLLV